MVTFIFRRSIALTACVYALHLCLVFPPAKAGPEQDELATPQGTPLGPCMEFEQIPLTEKQVLGLLASAVEIDEIRQNSGDGFYQTGPATTAKLDIAAKKNGLTGYEEFKAIRANVIQIFSGYDEASGRYVGREPLIRLRVARTKEDRKMSASEKTGEISSLNAQRRCTLPEVKYRSNIDLVHKY